MVTKKFDLVVLGSGPTGEKGAAQATYFGKNVALIEKEDVLGGAVVNYRYTAFKDFARVSYLSVGISSA